MLQKFEGIVLRTLAYGESHQIVLVFSELMGKVSIVARGAKKTKSRFGATTQPFTRANFICYIGKGMGDLSQADVIQSHHVIRSDLILTAYGAYWIELVNKLVPEKEPNSELYRFLVQSFTFLEQGIDPDVLTRIFELKVLKVAGYQPVLNQCVHCNGVEELIGFHPLLGGVICTNCLDKVKGAQLASRESIKILMILQNVDLSRLGNIQLKNKTRQHLEKMIHSFMDTHISLELKSRTILHQLLKDFKAE